MVHDLILFLNVDLWDLGEFTQRGSRRTKWGTIEELKQLSKAAEAKNIDIYFNAVLNHKAGADHTETCTAVECHPEGTSADGFYLIEIRSKQNHRFCERNPKLA